MADILFQPTSPTPAFPTSCFQVTFQVFPPKMISQGYMSPALRQEAVAPILFSLFSGVARPQLRANHSQNHCSVPMTWTWLNKLQWQAQKYSSNQLGRNLGPKQETSHKGKLQSGDNFFKHMNRKLDYQQGTEFCMTERSCWTAAWNK